MANEQQQQPPVQGATSEQAPPAARAEAPVEAGNSLSQKEQTRHHLDYVGLGADGTELVLNLKDCESGFHWMVLATVSRDEEATDPGIFLHIKDVLSTCKKRQTGEDPSREYLGGLSWLHTMARTGVDGTRYQVYFKPNQFRGDGFTVEKENVVATRVFWAEADRAGGDLQEQLNRIAELEEQGLRFNAVVDSGGKSIHLFIRAPQEMTVDWERDERILRKLAVTIKGDTKVCERSRSMRLAGFDRHAARPQVLLRGSQEHYYSSVEKLEEVIDRVLEQRGVTDWEAAFKELQEAENGLAATQVDETLEEHKDAASFSSTLVEWLISDIEEAAAFIPQREPGKGTYEKCRRALCGCAAAFAEIGLPEERALDLLASKWPDRRTAEQVLESSTTRNAASFWAIAAEHGYKQPRAKRAQEETLKKVEDERRPRSYGELTSLKYQELIDQSLAAIRNRDLDTEMLLKAELKNRFRLSDDFISTALMRRYAESKAQAVAAIHDSVALAQVEQLEYLMDGWIPKADVALTYGPFGTGKTSLAVWKAYGYAKGTNILDRDTNCPPGKVLIIATDSGPGALKKTFDDLGIDVDNDPLLQPEHPERRIWIWAHQPDQGHNSWVCDLHGLLRLEEHIKRHGISYVVIDSAKSVSASAGWSYTSNEAVKAMLTLLRQTICATTGACIEFLSHDGSIQGTHSGAKAWAEEPSMVIALSQIEAREGDNAAVRATFKKDRAAVVDPRRQLAYELNEDGLVLRPEVPVVSTCNGAILHVLWNAHLEGKDSLRTGEVIRAVGDLYLMAPKTVENTLPRISGSGKGPNPTPVIKVARGRYALSPREIEQRTAKNTPPYRGFCSTGGDRSKSIPAQGISQPPFHSSEVGVGGFAFLLKRTTPPGNPPRGIQKGVAKNQLPQWI